MGFLVPLIIVVGLVVANQSSAAKSAAKAMWHVLRPATPSLTADQIGAMLTTKQPLAAGLILVRDSGEQIYVVGPVQTYGYTGQPAARYIDVQLADFYGIDTDMDAGVDSKGLIPDDHPAAGTVVRVSDADLVFLVLQTTYAMEKAKTAA